QLVHGGDEAEVRFVRAHGRPTRQSNETPRDLSRPLHHQSAPAPLAPAVAGSGDAIAVTVCVTRTAAALGVSAMSVPKTITSTPAHIHATNGLMWALMIGRSVSLLRPE